jgi:hypothetical protein
LNSELSERSTGEAAKPLREEIPMDAKYAMELGVMLWSVAVFCIPILLMCLIAYICGDR